MNPPVHADGKSPSAQKAASGDAGAESFPAPLKPRPRLLIALSIIFAIWVAGLLVMYAKTVYPYRHDPARNAREVDR